MQNQILDEQDIVLVKKYEGDISFVQRQGSLTMITPQSKKKIWDDPISLFTYHPYFNVVVIAGGKTMTKMDVLTGTKLWTSTVPQNILSIQIFMNEDVLYDVGLGRGLFLLCGATGVTIKNIIDPLDMQWYFFIGSNIFSTTIQVPNHLLIRDQEFTWTEERVLPYLEHVMCIMPCKSIHHVIVVSLRGCYKYNWGHHKVLWKIDLDACIHSFAVDQYDRHMAIYCGFQKRISLYSCHDGTMIHELHENIGFPVPPISLSDNGTRLFFVNVKNQYVQYDMFPAQKKRIYSALGPKAPRRLTLLLLWKTM